MLQSLPPEIFERVCMQCDILTVYRISQIREIDYTPWISAHFLHEKIAAKERARINSCLDDPPYPPYITEVNKMRAKKYLHTGVGLCQDSLIMAISEMFGNGNLKLYYQLIPIGKRNFLREFVENFRAVVGTQCIARCTCCDENWCPKMIHLLVFRNLSPVSFRQFLDHPEFLKNRASPIIIKRFAWSMIRNIKSFEEKLDILCEYPSLCGRLMHSDILRDLCEEYDTDPARVIAITLSSKAFLQIEDEYLMEYLFKFGKFLGDALDSLTDDGKHRCRELLLRNITKDPKIPYGIETVKDTLEKMLDFLELIPSEFPSEMFVYDSSEKLCELAYSTSWCETVMHILGFRTRRNTRPGHPPGYASVRYWDSFYKKLKAYRDGCVNFLVKGVCEFEVDGYKTEIIPVYTHNQELITKIA